MGINCVNFSVVLLCIVFSVSSETTNDTSSGNCGPKETWEVYMDFVAEAIDKAKNSSITLEDTAGNCGHKKALISYLEVAAEMIKKAKVKFPTVDGNTLPQHKDMHCEMIKKAKVKFPTGEVNTLPQHKDMHSLGNRDCSDLLLMGHRSSGVYTICPRIKYSETKAFDVYCDMETDGGGWTVIQRRGDFQNPVDYFYKDWKSYKEGFGDLEKEFWLGNDNLFALTNQGIYSVRFDLVDAEGNTAYAHYDVFRIDDEDSKYTLHISNYSGNAGDSMAYSNNMKFTTRDQDNDLHPRNCAELFKGPWWFSDCSYAHLNGENLKGKVSTDKGKIWHHWKGKRESLAKTEIKIRPKNLMF